MDVGAGQSCSQTALENSKCLWENRVIGKSYRGNQKQDIPKQTKWHGATLLEAGRLSILVRTCGQGVLGGEAEVDSSAGETTLREEHVSAQQATQSKEHQRSTAMWSSESPMFGILPWQMKTECAGPGQPWPRGAGADVEPL